MPVIPLPDRPGLARRSAWRRRALALGCLVGSAAWAQGLPAPAPDGPHPATRRAPAHADTDTFAQDVLDLVNQQREGLGLAPWRHDPALAALAAERSRAMAQAGQLSHAGFDAVFQRSQRWACVENLAQGLRQPPALVAAWLASPAHRRNLVAPGMTDAGVALVAGYATLLACR